MEAVPDNLKKISERKQPNWRITPKKQFMTFEETKMKNELSEKKRIR